MASRELVQKMSREELEDGFFRLYDDNLELKRKINDQEDKMKRLATKFLRSKTGGKERAIDGNEMLVEMQERMVELEKQNNVLRDKLKVARHQLATYAHMPISTQYKAAIAASKAGSRPGSRPVSVIGGGVSPLPSLAIPDNVTGHIGRPQTRPGEGGGAGLQNQIITYQREIEHLKAQIRNQQAQFETTLIKSRSQLERRATAEDNIEIIRLERQLREQTNESTQCRTKLSILEQDLQSLRGNYDNLLREYEAMSVRLREEQGQNALLQGQVRSASIGMNAEQMQLKHDVDALRMENNLLKETNEKLINSAFDPERERDRQTQEHGLRSRVAELEMALQQDAHAKSDLLEKLAHELANKDKLEQEHREMKSQVIKARADYEGMVGRLNRITKDQGVEVEELEEAIIFLKQKRERQEMSGVSTYPSFIEPVSREQEGVQQQLSKLEICFAESVQELEKTRNMLIVQHRINADYQTEVEHISKLMEDNKREFEDKMTEMASTLDQRAVRIQKLEQQLREIAYGVKPSLEHVTEKGVTEVDDMLDLSPGQNLVEIHVSKIQLSQEALEAMQAREPSTFLTIEFFDFELQFTPIMKGGSSVMDFTAQFPVVVNELFLHYVGTENAYVELHQAFGTAYQTLGAGQIALKELLSKPPGKMFGTMRIMAITGNVGADYGSIDYWLRIRMPMDEALHLYRERAMALGFLIQDEKGTAAATVEPDVNQLQIQIHRCQGLNSRERPDQPPSAYCLYSLYDFAEHDTPVMHSHPNPEFNNAMTWTLPMDSKLDSYLRSQNLRILVFDDAASTDEMSYLGHVDVPLLPLAHNNPIRGTFHITMADNLASGTMDISLNWQYTYIGAREAMIRPHPTIELPPESKIDLPEKLQADVVVPSVVAQARPSVRYEETAAQPPLIMPPLPTSDKISQPSSIQEMPSQATAQQEPFADQRPRTPPGADVPQRPHAPPRSDMAQRERPTPPPRRGSREPEIMRIEPEKEGAGERIEDEEVALQPAKLPSGPLGALPSLGRPGGPTRLSLESSSSQSLEKPPMPDDTQPPSESLTSAPPPEVLNLDQGSSGSKRSSTGSRQGAPKPESPAQSVASRQSAIPDVILSPESAVASGSPASKRSTGSAPKTLKVQSSTEKAEGKSLDAILQSTNAMMVPSESEGDDELDVISASGSKTPSAGTRQGLQPILSTESQPKSPPKSAKSEPEAIIPAVEVNITTVTIPADSPLWQTVPAANQLFIEWSWLGLAPEECETPQSQPFPESSSDAVEFECRQRTELEEPQQKRLVSLLESNRKIEFSLVSDPGDEGECEDLGTVAVILNAERDADDTVQFKNEDNVLVATARISVKVSEAYAQIKAFQRIT